MLVNFLLRYWVIIIPEKDVKLQWENAMKDQK